MGASSNKCTTRLDDGGALQCQCGTANRLALSCCTLLPDGQGAYTDRVIVDGNDRTSLQVFNEQGKHVKESIGDNLWGHV